MGWQDMSYEGVRRALMADDAGSLLATLAQLEDAGEMAAAQQGYADFVARLLGHQAPEVVGAAALTLGSMGSVGVHYAGFMEGMVKNDDASVRASVAEGLGRMGHHLAGMGEKLVGLLSDTDKTVRAAAARAIGNIGDEHLADTVAKLLSDASPVVVAAACEALGSLQAADAYADEIVDKLKNDRTRYSALSALGTLGPKVPARGVGQIVSCLTDGDIVTREAAVRCLAALRDVVWKDEAAMTTLKEMLNSARVGERAAAACTLGSLGSNAAEHASAVAQLLMDGDEDTSRLALVIGCGASRMSAQMRKPHCAALLALGGMRAESFAADILKSFGNKDWEIRLCALGGAASLGDPDHASKIAELLEDNAYMVRAKAAEVLGTLKAEPAVGNLAEALEDTSSSVRMAALLSLSKMRTHNRYSNEVVKLLEDSSGAVQGQAALCLASMGTTGVCYVGVIATMLNEEDPAARCGAMAALGKMKVGSNYAEEVAANLNDGHAMVREAAFEALTDMGKEGERYIQSARPAALGAPHMAAAAGMPPALPGGLGPVVPIPKVAAKERTSMDLAVGFLAEFYKDTESQ